MDKIIKDVYIHLLIEYENVYVKGSTLCGTFAKTSAYQLTKGRSFSWETLDFPFNKFIRSYATRKE